jgi:hypothetical protein
MVQDSVNPFLVRNYVSSRVIYLLSNLQSRVGRYRNMALGVTRKAEEWQHHHSLHSPAFWDPKVPTAWLPKASGKERLLVPNETP